MSQFSAQLRREPDWTIRYKDPIWRESWASQAAERVWKVQAPSAEMDVKLSTKQIQYVLDELEGYARLYDQNTPCWVSCFERIWESSELVDEQLSQDFILHLADLDRRDQVVWRHGGSRGLIINAPEKWCIDPLLYPIIYGTTLFSHPINGRRLPVPAPVAEDVYTISSCFCMLPTDVHVSRQGTARFLSYINNLHPQDAADLYSDLERLLTRTIPLFERTLTDLHRNNPVSARIKGTSHYVVWDEPDAPEHSDDEEGWISYERSMRDWVMNRPIQLPEVPGNYPGRLEYRRYAVSLRDRRIQIIPRLIQIDLEHDKSWMEQHCGFDWRVEGMRNERIVACSLHVLRCDNLLPVSIDFRMAVAHPIGYAPGDEGATRRTWGFKNRDPCHQYIGSVPLKQNATITFPNIYQYRISGMKIDDKEKNSASLTLLFLSLVDPDINPVLSTTSVPPQQPQWIKPAVYESLESWLPPELVDIVWGMCDWLIDTKKAEEYRGDYMDTLAAFTKKNNHCYFGLPFDGWARAQ